MLINWFTVAAQIINFLILLFLLKRFLYEPIVKTIDTRQQKIEASWNKALKQQEIAKQEASLAIEKQQELDLQKEAMLTEAREKAEQTRKELIQQARSEIQTMEEEWKKSLDRQQDLFYENLRQQLARQSLEITRRALQDMANAKLEQQAISVFFNRLQNLQESETKQIVESIKNSSENLVVTSSFELSPQVRQYIVNFLKKQNIVNDEEVTFTVDNNLILGISLNTSDSEIAWNFAEYLQNLEEYYFQYFKDFNKKEREHEGK